MKKMACVKKGENKKDNRRKYKQTLPLFLDSVIEL